MLTKSSDPLKKKTDNERSSEKSIPLYPDEQFQIDTLNEKPRNTHNELIEQSENDKEKSRVKRPKDPFDEDPTGEDTRNQ